MQMHINHIYTAIYALKEDIDSLYEYMRVLSTRNTNMAYSLDGYLWAISSLVTEKMQICCMQQTSVVTIDPPLWIIDISNGCEAFSSMIYIPAKSELTAAMQSLTRSQFFLNYNFKFIKIFTFVVF